MEDRQIVELYHKRNPLALRETAGKYGRYLSAVSYNIVADREDSEECVNDTYLSAWNSMPPQRPQYLKAFLAKIIRRISIDLVRRKTAQKRGGSEYQLSLEELESEVFDGKSVEETVEDREFEDGIRKFVQSLNPLERNIFVSRYFFFDTVPNIARDYAVSVAKVKNTLVRVRKKLKEHLISQGVKV